MFGFVPKQNGVWFLNDIEDTKSQVVWHVGIVLCIEPLQPNTQPSPKSLLGMKGKARFKYHLFLYALVLYVQGQLEKKRSKQYFCYCLQ
jgi:hypothetical protein